MKYSARKIVALVFTAATIAMTAGCGTGTGGGSTDKNNSGTTAKAPDYLNTQSALPIVKSGKNVKLKIMLMAGAYYQNMSKIQDVYFVNAYEKKTNVKVDWAIKSMDSFNDSLALMLSSGTLPDVIMKSGISNSSQFKYGDQGYFLNLMDKNMLQTYAPNYWALTKKYPEILSSSMMPDGQVYSLGLVRNSVGSIVAGKLYFNQDWLKAVGMSVPTTSQQFLNVLTAFKSKDPNKNGMADEVGLYISPSQLEYATFGMFGIGNRGMCNTYIDCDTSTGKARYFPITNGYRNWLTYVINLYKKGLLNKEFMDFTESKLGTYVNNNVCGVFGYNNLSMISQNDQKKMTYLQGSLTGPNGDKTWYGTNAVGSTGAYVITKACKYPEVALRWADYFYSDEGALFYYYGDPNVTYMKNSDGTYKYSNNVLKNYYNGTNSYDGCTTYVSLYAYGFSPTKTQVPFNSADDNNGIALLSANKLINDCPIAWPSFTFTRSEQRVIEDTKNDLDSYVNSQKDAWIMGNAPLNDQTWNEFVQTIQKMDVDDVLDTYNAALARIKKDGFKDGHHTLNEFK